MLLILSFSDLTVTEDPDLVAWSIKDSHTWLLRKVWAFPTMYKPNLARVSATFILLLSERKPIFPASLDRTQEKYDNIFFSPLGTRQQCSLPRRIEKYRILFSNVALATGNSPSSIPCFSFAFLLAFFNVLPDATPDQA